MNTQNAAMRASSAINSCAAKPHFLLKAVSYIFCLLIYSLINVPKSSSAHLSPFQTNTWISLTVPPFLKSFVLRRNDWIERLEKWKSTVKLTKYSLKKICWKITSQLKIIIRLSAKMWGSAFLTQMVKFQFVSPKAGQRLVRNSFLNPSGCMIWIM